MSSNIPALPNQPPEPEENKVEKSSETQREQEPQAAGDDEKSPSAPVFESPPAPPQATPPMPAMPAMPDPSAGDFDDDDDIEIPDESELEQERQGRQAPAADAQGAIKGVIVSIRDDGAFVDVGEKAEAFLPIPAAKSSKRPDWQPGDQIEVIVAGRSPDGDLLLAPVEAQRPTEFAQLEAAFATGGAVIGKVVEAVKGGLAVDVAGARAFLPASRSGERDQETLEGLVGQEIRARILQLEIEDRNVVLDRRSLVEEERENQRQETVSGLRAGAVVKGAVRNIRDFGAFIDLGGIDALLHISDISWARVEDIRAVLKEGDEFDVKVLRVEDDGRRIAVGRKQLEPDPWTVLADQVSVGDRIRGKVTRLKDFGAFVEVIPGAEGLIHVSEMSWAKRIRHPSDVVNEGDEVDVVVLDINIGSRRIALGLKQALGDPWDRIERDYPVGSVVEGVVRKTTNFGAFVEIVDGVEGLLHVSDITSERRLNHPTEVLKLDDRVRVQVLELNREKRRLKLGMKQLEPTETDRFIEHIQAGDTVTGRVVRVREDEAEIELGEGVRGICRIDESALESAQANGEAAAAAGDVSSMGAMLEAAWKGGSAAEAESAKLQEGELRSFKIASVDASSGLIELRLL